MNSYNKYYDEMDELEEMEYSRRKGGHRNGHRNTAKEQAKRKERDRRAAQKYEANMECIEKFGMSIKEKRKLDKHNRT